MVVAQGLDFLQLTINLLNYLATDKSSSVTTIAILRLAAALSLHPARSCAKAFPWISSRHGIVIRSCILDEGSLIRTTEAYRGYCERGR